MVDRRLSDGVRIGQFLASDLEGYGGALAGVAVVDADPDVEPTVDGARAFALTDGDRRIATVYAHPERVRIEFVAGVDRAAAAAREADLRVRPAATDPPRTLVFVEDGAEVKRALGVVEAVVRVGEGDGSVGR